MQSASSRIWTRVAVSISSDDNHYTTGTSTGTIGRWLNTAPTENTESHWLNTKNREVFLLPFLIYSSWVESAS